MDLIGFTLHGSSTQNPPNGLTILSWHLKNSTSPSISHSPLEPEK
ncbi:hypothetical protein QUF74_07945 [Candidatus Halobeggiatoa sp. HSG11]|nr:hypothetical protein [Candidatus Halobeggiatoa sp. HSG11]